MDKYVIGSTPFGHFIFDSETQERAYIDGKRIPAFAYLREAELKLDQLNREEAAA